MKMLFFKALVGFLYLGSAENVRGALDLYFVSCRCI